MSALVVLAVVLWVLPTPSRKAVELTAGACGYLRGGARQAVLVTLHLRGAVAPARRGGLKAVGQLVGSTDPYERAVYGALHDPIGLRAIRARKRVIEVGSETARRLVRAGLLPTGRWLLVRLATGAVVVLGLFGLIADAPATSSMAAFTAVVFAGLALLALPRRTRAGRRALATLRREYPRDGELSAMAVAAHGPARWRFACRRSRPGTAGRTATATGTPRSRAAGTAREGSSERRSREDGRQRGQRAPVLGVNLGKLGFLGEVDVPELPDALWAIDGREFTIEPRLGRGTMCSGIAKTFGAGGGVVASTSAAASAVDGVGGDEALVDGVIDHSGAVAPVR